MGDILRRGTADEAGVDPIRLQHAFDLLERWAASDQVPGSALAVARHGILLEPRGFGVRTAGPTHFPMLADAVFLVASVTKPATAMAALLLVERGELSLGDRVCDIVPEFAGQGKGDVRLVHLLTHTSGLPDMLPNNVELRERHAPLAEFVDQICRVGLLFEPGTQVRYQSMGTAMLGEIVQRLAGRDLRDFLRAEIFTPLAMSSTSLALADELRSRLADVVLPEEQRLTDWHWNSEYWRGFGAPWGGMYSTVTDQVTLLQMLLRDGACGTGRILGPAAAKAMLADQTNLMPDLPARARPGDRWGLGWHLGTWGDLGSPRTFSHGGATGTLVGADPDTGLACAIFTTQPGAPLHRVASAVQGALT